MKKYRIKDPVIVEAVQFDPDNVWPDCVYPWPKEEYQSCDTIWGYIETVKGKTHVRFGDWIVKGITTGPFFVCKPDIFEETYELVGDSMTTFAQ